ncbi:MULTISPECIES: nucleotide disphospho-sugar-binding domain-containing protein [unclassified Mycobacterium]|uniref:nucleotide disphospho-sugar-binding domain-containing protein n=1 Tax=unclassified Mycobacterium TaxID=2642494 RepID=UPI0029C7DEE9|nr:MULTISPECIES: nucleotide disphospho-sugar-binding domain-containing protein [unclassified Mycobacterium]
MAEILIASLSPTGHISPLLSVAQDLVARGDRVTVMTGAVHTDAVLAVGAHPHPLSEAADFDQSPFDASSRGKTSKVKALNLAIIRLFLAPMPHQYAELTSVLATTRFDAIIADYGFFGVIPLLVGHPAARPPILQYTPTPMMLSSRDTAPSGLGLPPGSGWFGRLRNRVLTQVSQRVILRESQRATNAMLGDLGVQHLPVFLLDVGVLADRFIVPTVPSFEYPRRDLAPNVRFVGAVHPQPSNCYVPPTWWSELDGSRPVVHVTQGTVDNEDLSRLIEPTIEALANEDVTLVVTTGGRDINDLAVDVPPNTFVAEYIPHDVLLPKVDVMVTNGGYGAVQRAVSTGVPLVVAGNTEDKPEVAARVAWSGAGLNLKTGTPSPAMIRDAVRELLGDCAYLRRARELEAAFAQRHGIAEISALVDEVVAERGGQRRRSRAS